jgi:hypothetical protein
MPRCAARAGDAEHGSETHARAVRVLQSARGGGRRSWRRRRATLARLRRARLATATAAPVVLRHMRGCARATPRRGTHRQRRGADGQVQQRGDARARHGARRRGAEVAQFSILGRTAE